MPAKVLEVKKNSIAEELEIAAGDEILSIDGVVLRDLIDYNFYCKSEELVLEIKKTNGEIEEIELEKDFDEDLGITFESAVFDKIKLCQNHCIFCFVDQQPKGLRKSLYVKDDDYRLSYLQGTYITLTNLTEADWARIEQMRLGPFYVSVHTTNPKLRAEMLRNPNAANICEHLKRFKKAQIPFHAQIVLCPEYNDGKELERTLTDLKKLGAASVAIVPLGLTKFRKENLTPVTPEIARQTIEIAARYKNVCCADEFFLKAGVEIPPTKYYGSFLQLADGVGTIRLLLDDFAKLNAPKSLKNPLKLLLTTSQAAFGALSEISKELNKITNLETSVCAVKSTYWGKDITVAGLITSEDLINTIKNKVADLVVLPSVMLRPFSTDFLDGKTLSDVEAATGKSFFIVNDCSSMKELVEFLKKI